MATSTPALRVPPPAAAPTPPGPRGPRALSVVPAIARDPYRSFQRLARTYGDVVRVPAPGLRLVLVSHPDHVKHIMNTRHADYPKPALLRDIWHREPPRFHGMANGEDWRRVRRMLNTKFSARGLAPLAELMFDTIEGCVDGWQDHVRAGRPVDMQEELSALTLAVMMRSMFTRRPAPEEIERLSRSFVVLMRGMAVAMLTTPLPARVPRPYARATAAAMADITAYIDTMVAERRQRPVEHEDLLSMVLDGRFEDGSRMTDEHVRRELVGLIFGGYETTAAVMSWVLARLPFEDVARERALAEIDALGGRRIAEQDIDGLVWLRACFDEAQRLQGFALNAREAMVDDVIGGYAIPAGTTVAFSGWTMHRDPRFWRAPDAFLPERFLEDEINPYSFLPFGVGPRRCLGMRMGYLVGLATLATALQRYTFTPPPGWRPEPKFTFSSVVKGGVPLTLRSREAVA